MKMYYCCHDMQYNIATRLLYKTPRKYIVKCQVAHPRDDIITIYLIFTSAVLIFLTIGPLQK